MSTAEILFSGESSRARHEDLLREAAENRLARQIRGTEESAVPWWQGLAGTVRWTTHHPASRRLPRLQITHP